MKNMRNLIFQELPDWHQKMLSRLLGAAFQGQQELRTQILTARFTTMENGQSLEISPVNTEPAPVVKTIPVEASALDEDGVPIQALLFTGHGLAYMLDVFRADGDPIRRLPPPSAFEVMVLKP
jgi:hypothetical protein